MDLDRGRHARRRRLVRGAGSPALTTRRVAVVGGPGSGKTTVAAELSRRLGVDHVELDALWWDADWHEAGAPELRARLTSRLEAARGNGWVVDGNYLDEVAHALVWPTADTLVWLDLPRRTAYRRAVTRTVRRLARRQPLWNGNRETPGNLSPASLLRLWRRWPAYGQRIAALLAELGDDAPPLVRLRADREVRAWLAADQIGR